MKPIYFRPFIGVVCFTPFRTIVVAHFVGGGFKYFFLVTPILGEMMQFDEYFSFRWVETQPPTRQKIRLQKCVHRNGSVFFTRNKIHTCWSFVENFGCVFFTRVFHIAVLLDLANPGLFHINLFIWVHLRSIPPWFASQKTHVDLRHLCSQEFFQKKWNFFVISSPSWSLASQKITTWMRWIEQWPVDPGLKLLYRGDYTTQLYGDCNKPL